MSTGALQVLSRLRHAGIAIQAEQGELRVVAPQGTWTPELRRDVLEHKGAILRLLADASADRSLPDRAIPRLEGDESVMASFAQERFWFLDRLEPGGSAYHVGTALRLSGVLDLRALERSVADLLARHEALRTGFAHVDGQLIQVVQPPTDPGLPMVDLSATPAPGRDAQLRQLLHEESAQPCDLGAGAVFRAKVWREDDDTHVVLIVIHHIACDGWSIGIICRELSVFYNAHARGEAPSLPPLPLRYADFAAWQRGWIKGEVWRRQLAYWTRQLAAPLPILELPTDRPRPLVQTYTGAEHKSVLPITLADGVRQLGRQEGATLFMTLLAAFVVLVHRYTGAEDIIVGSPVANRNRVETEGIVGVFVNTLALRANVSGRPSFREFVARVREVCLGAYAHQDLPFEKLVQELSPERRLDRNPLSSVLFAMQDAAAAYWSLTDLRVDPVAELAASVRCDLEVHVVESPAELEYTIIYNTDLFDATTIARMTTHFEVLLQGLVADADRSVAAVPLLPPAERAYLLTAWNQTATDYPRGKCVHELFEAQVERTPNNVAVEFGTEQITYRELNRRANHLAHQLQALGVGPDVPTGICIDRSIEWIVGVLAILKAGGAYVPMDPSWPIERLRFVVEDTRAPVLLASRQFCDDSFMSLPGCTCVTLETASASITAASAENLRSGAGAESLAYVIYTSGSTGVPKGVAVPHRAVNRLVVNTNYVQFRPTDVVAQAANAAFDAATFEVWGALLHGARLVILGENVVLSTQELQRVLVDRRITTMFLTTALFHVVAQEVPSALKSLTHLLVGGDALEPRWARAVLESGPPARLLNAYGPTETTTFATWQLVDVVAPHATTVPIGRPISNTEAFILDADLEPVPIGVVGELYIGGDGLARGYLHRPTLSADAFGQHPFSQQSGARLYRTGDRARFLPDGRIECLGRVDHQVKIRGYRVELGEVEAVLRNLPGVQDAVVMAREDAPGDKRLAAYLVLEPDNRLDVAEMRRRLRAQLPEYMVPAAFVGVDALPLTASGKVDRRALPAPQLAVAESEMAKPRTPTQVMLAGIWGEILGVEQVGIDDNFFDLGGHSLLAVQLQRRIEQAVGRTVSVAAFFQAPTIREFSQFLAGDGESIEGVHLFTPEAPPDQAPLFCLHFLSASQSLARSFGNERPVYGIETPLQEALLRWHTAGERTVSLEELAERAIACIRRVRPRGPYHLAGFCFGGVLAFEVARQLSLQGQQIGLLALLDATYAPGCRQLAVPWLGRAAYHGAATWRLGPGYLRTKFLERRRVKKQRQLSLRHAGSPPGREGAERGQGLPQAALLRAILDAYVGEGHALEAVVFRSVAAPTSFSLDLGRTSGWDRVALGGVHLEEIHCGHMDICQEPHVSEIARRLKAYLATAVARHA